VARPLVPRVVAEVRRAEVAQEPDADVAVVDLN
jgi:hypothetical protein